MTPDQRAAVNELARSERTQAAMWLHVDRADRMSLNERHTRFADALDAVLTLIDEFQRKNLRLLEQAGEMSNAMKQAEQARDALRKAIRAALCELGVPTQQYPAPVSNAWDILQRALGAPHE